MHNSSLLNIFIRSKTKAFDYLFWIQVLNIYAGVLFTEGVKLCLEQEEKSG